MSIQGHPTRELTDGQIVDLLSTALEELSSRGADKTVAVRYPAISLSDRQIVELLNTAREQLDRERTTGFDVRSITEMPSAELLQRVQEAMKTRGIDMEEAARLLGVAKLTIKRWFETSKPLSDDARQRLAGLCILLSLVEGEVRGVDTATLVRSAMTSLRGKPFLDGSAAQDEVVETLTSVFNVRL
jgi:transcriptional regulator with XRE-family HTH domain